MEVFRPFYSIGAALTLTRPERKLDGRAEARIIELACGPVPQGHSRWTIRLLEEQSRVVLETPVSREAIRRALKKMNFDLTAMATGASPKKTMPNL